MNQIIHIIKKDARRLRWGLVGWFITVAASTAVSIAAPSMQLRGFAIGLVATQLVSLIAFVELIMTALVVSWLVHEDPLVGGEAFWITRPIDPRSLAAAKLAFAGAALVLLPLVAKFVVMAAFHVSLRDMWLATPAILLAQLAPVALLMAAAALTPSITRYILLIVGAVATFVILVGAVVTGFLLFTTISESSNPGPQIVDPRPTVILTTLATAITLWVVVYQYLHRRPRRAAMIGGAGLLATLILPTFWPFHFARQPEPDPGAWARDETRVTAVFDPEPVNVSDTPSDFSRRENLGKQLAGRVRLTGLPDDETVSGIEVHSRLGLADALLTSTSNTRVSVRRGATPDGIPDRLRTFQAALGRVRLTLPAFEQDYEQWPVLLRLPDQELARHAGKSGRLTATLDFYLQHSTADQAIPLEPGQAFREETRRIEIVGIDRRVDGCTAILREIAIVPLLTPHTFAMEEFVLRNASRGEAVLGGQESFESSASSPLPFFFAVALGGGAYGAGGSSGAGFTVRTFAVRYPSRDSRDSTGPSIDPTWLDNAELVRIKTRYAGHVSRRLTVDDFRIPK